jgi:hypothetical protein
MARITGVLTVGQGSVTINGDSSLNTISGVTTVYTTSINDLGYPSAGPLSNRNLIINGAMQVAQRSSDIDFSANAQYPACDRWKTSIDLPSGVTNLNFSQDSDAPSGFANSYKISPNQAASGALATADRIWIEHLIEGQNLQHLAYGTADAKTCILSFWFKSNLTGKVGIEIIIPGLQSYHASFTVNTADTWEFKTITINPNTTDTLVNTNAVGVSISWQFAAGPTFTGGSRTENSWQTVTNNDERAPSDIINLYSSANNYVNLTGVQLEVGERATPFEHRSYGDEFNKCLRYYFKPDCEGSAKQKMMGMSYGTNTYYIPFELPVPMRVGPTVNAEGGGQWRSRTNNINNFDVTWTTHGTNTPTNVMLQTSGGSIPAGTTFWFETHDSTGCNLEFSAEL